jgi:hypothetical protein
VGKNNTVMIVCATIAIVSITAILLQSHAANAAFDKGIAKLMPPQLRNDMVDPDTKEVTACSPYAQHQNDNYTTTRFTEICYNALAGVAQACDPSDGMLYGFTTYVITTSKNTAANTVRITICDLVFIFFVNNVDRPHFLIFYLTISYCYSQ